MSDSTFTPKALAHELGISDKRMRSFIRSLAKSDAGVPESACPPGQGQRYAMTAHAAETIRNAWEAAHAGRSQRMQASYNVTPEPTDEDDAIVLADEDGFDEGAASEDDANAAFDERA